MLIKLTKLVAAPNAFFPAANKENYQYGKDNYGVSLPVDYWLEGYLLNNEIKEGERVVVERTNRNGVECKGLFTSSLVKKVDKEKGLFWTENSTYKVEVLKENKS